MRARSFLFETDNRTTIEKIRALIDNPSTLETVREVAKAKLAKLCPETTQVVTPNKPRPSINLSEASLDQPFSYWGGQITCRQIYENLADMKPMPSDVAFFRQGQIHIMVPPPYLGLTKAQFTEQLLKAVPGARKVTAKFVETKGYHFVVSLI